MLFFRIYKMTSLQSQLQNLGLDSQLDRLDDTKQPSLIFKFSEATEKDRNFFFSLGNFN